MLVFLFSALATLVVSTITIMSMRNTVANMNSAQENMDTTEEFLVRNYEYRLRASAAVAQTLLDAGDLDRLRIRPNSPDSPEAWFKDAYFLELRDKLIAFAEENGLEFIYFYHRIDNYIQPLIDNDPNRATAFTPSSALIPIDHDVMDAWDDIKITLAMTEEFLVDLDGLMTAYAPIINYYGEVAAIVGIDIKDEQIQPLREQIDTLSGRTESLSGRMHILIIGMISALALLLVGGILTFLANRKRSDVLQEALTDAEHANRAKSDFLATMSHEIRTPLNAILGITEIQLQNEGLGSTVRESLGKIFNSGELLLGIINDILDLSKIEAGKLELLIGDYEIAGMLNDTSQLNMMRIGSKPIKFELEADENIPSALRGDELRVKQILNNLLSNAFKYTSEGLVRLTVTSEPGASGSGGVTLVFRVSDTGQGMTDEQISRLFDEYSRFNQQANRTTEGTGLGMSITRNLVRLMNGAVSVQSAPGKGTEFTVRLPQGVSDPRVLGKDMSENLRHFREAAKARLERDQIVREPMPYGSVLIVDDVDTNIFVAEGLMTPYGLKIDSADSGFTAIDKIKDGNVYDIVFMDHMMPKMDGIEATQIIRAMGYEKPIVALTANAVVGQSDIFLSNGFDDFVSKPIDVRQLNTVLNRLIRDKQEPEVIEAARKQAAQEPAQGDGSLTSVQENTPPALTPALDPRFAEIFTRDAEKALTALEAIRENGDYRDKDDLRTYIIYVHGMKSALANIKEAGLSAMALKLELAGREENFAVIEAETPVFILALRKFVGDLNPKPDDNGSSATDEDALFLEEKLLAVKSACADFDENAADEALMELRGKKWSPQTKELLDTVSGHLLHSDFDEAVKAIEERFS